MKFTRQEIFKLRVLVSERSDELQECLNFINSSRLKKSSQYIKKSIKEYEELEKKLDTLYQQLLLDYIKKGQD